MAAVTAAGCGLWLEGRGSRIRRAAVWLCVCGVGVEWIDSISRPMLECLRRCGGVVIGRNP